MKNMTIKFEKIREIILVLLLGVWMIIPVLKEINMIWPYVLIYEDTFIKVVGCIGLFFMIFDINKNINNNKDIKEYSKKMIPVIIMSIFMIWTFISAIFAEDITRAFKGHYYRKEGYITYLSYAGFFSCVFLIKSRKKIKALINMFVGISILNIILVELPNRGIFTGIIDIRDIYRTCFFNSNHHGYYLLLATITSIFLFITQKNKYIKFIHLIEYVFLLYYLILNDTLGVYLALVLTLILFLIYSIWYKQKRFLAVISIIIFVLMSFSIPKIRIITQQNLNSLYNDVKIIVNAYQIKNKKTNTKKEEKDKQNIIKKVETLGTDRVLLWKNGVKFFLEKPILGYGPDNIERKYIDVGIYMDRPHNLLIQLATTSGIIGVASYISAVGIILIRGFKTMKMENSIHMISFFAVIAYLISAMFGNSMYYTSPYFFIFLGMLMHENVNKIE